MACWGHDPATDPILSRFREAVAELYGNRLNGIILFGSRARGDARAGSDDDLRVRFLDETGAFIDAKPYPASAHDDRTPLMREIRQDGLRL